MPPNGQVYSMLEGNTVSSLLSSSGNVGFTLGQVPATGLLAITSFILFLFLAASSGAAVIRILYALGLRVGTFGEPSDINMSKSKKIISTVLFALIGSFSLVLFMLAVNPDVVRGTVDFSKIANVGGGVGTAPATTGTQTQTPPPTAQTSATYQARLASHNATVARLSAVGISTNRGNAPCTEAQFGQTTPACTSLAFLPEETIQMLIRLKTNCTCSLIISGGTEPGHSSHRENWNPVDLRIRASQDTTDPLYKYVSVAGTPTGATASCYANYFIYNFTFCDEKPRSNSTWNPHFHVYIKVN